MSTNKADGPFELLHMDIWGPYALPSIYKQRYFLIIVDDFSRYTWVTLLKGKHQVQSLVQSFVALVERQFNASVKVIKTDNGPKFTLSSYYANKGIIHQTSCMETPQQNGRVERKHRFIFNIARALMIQSGIPKFLWNYAMQHAVFLINRVPSNVLGGKTPYQVLHGATADINQLKVLGPLCYVSTLANHRGKLDSRAKKCVFLGYKFEMKGYVAYDCNSREILISRHVFYEHVFPCISLDRKAAVAPWSYIDLSSIPELAVTTSPDDLQMPHTPDQSPQELANTPLSTEPVPNTDPEPDTPDAHREP